MSTILLELGTIVADLDRVLGAEGVDGRGDGCVRGWSHLISPRLTGPVVPGEAASTDRVESGRGVSGWSGSLVRLGPELDATEVDGFLVKLVGLASFGLEGM